MFTGITVPMVSPSLFFLLVVDTIAVLQAFTQIHLLTRGGPVDATRVLVYSIYQDAFQNFLRALDAFVFRIADPDVVVFRNAISVAPGLGSDFTDSDRMLLARLAAVGQSRGEASGRGSWSGQPEHLESVAERRAGCRPA